MLLVFLLLTLFYGVSVAFNVVADSSTEAASNLSANSAIQLWNFTTDGSAYSSVVVGDGYIYAVSSDYGGQVKFNLYCLNASTGAQIWNYLETGTYAGSPIVSNGQVYIGTFSNGIHSFNASTGVKLWNFTNSVYYGFTNFFYSGSPVVAGDYLYFSGQSFTTAFVFCLNASTGAQIWNYTTPQGRAFSNLVISGGYVYAIRGVYTENPFSHSLDVYTFNASNGAKIWNSAASGYPNPPVVAGGNIYVSSYKINPRDSSHYDGNVYAFNGSSGAELWSFGTGSNVTPPTVAEGVIYFGSGNGNFYALNSSNGAKIWNTPFSASGANLYSSDPQKPMVLANGYFYASSGNTLYCLETSTGTIIWSYKTDSTISSSLSVSGNMIYFGTGEPQGGAGYQPVWHKAYALDASTGTELWNYDFKGSINSQLIVVGDTVYVSLSHVMTDPWDYGDGGVYALKQITVAPPTPIPAYSPSNAPPPDAIIVPDDFPTIQEAVKNASAGATIFVRRGTYYSSQFNQIFINKSLTLIGENPKNTVIDGQSDKYASYRGDPPHRITFTIEGANVTISGFTITNCPMVMSIERDSCKIFGNTIANSSNGIRLISEHNVISENNITGISDTAITLSRSNNWISDNTISGSGLIGIKLVSGGNVTVTANSLSGNGLTALDTGYLFSRGGILLSHGGPYYVYGNNITDNQDFGIQFDVSCQNSQVHDNNIVQNDVGINLVNFVSYGDYVFGLGNVVFKNNFMDNSPSVFVEHTYYRYSSSDLPNGTDVVSWDNGKEGNYWSDYHAKYPNATEIGNSGIGDTRYVIDANNIDNYPLMRPFGTSVKPSPSSSPLPSSSSPASLLTITLTTIVVIVLLAVLFLVSGKRRKRAKNSPPASGDRETSPIAYLKKRQVSFGGLLSQGLMLKTEP